MASAMAYCALRRRRTLITVFRHFLSASRLFGSEDGPEGSVFGTVRPGTEVRGAFFSVPSEWLITVGVTAWARDFASMTGYVIEVATALDMAASRKVNCGHGFPVLGVGKSLFNVFSTAKVMAGFRVKMMDALYPAQKPSRPRSDRICKAISFMVSFSVWLGVVVLDGSLAATSAAVC